MREGTYAHVPRQTRSTAIRRGSRRGAETRVPIGGRRRAWPSPARFHFVDSGVDVLELAPFVDDLGLSRRVQLEDLLQVDPVPTIEPSTFVPFSTVSKMGSWRWLSAGSPTNTRVPPRRSEPYACSKALGETASAIAASVPPRVLIAAAGSSWRASRCRRRPVPWPSRASRRTGPPPRRARRRSARTAAPGGRARRRRRWRPGRTSGARHLHDLVPGDAGAGQGRGLERGSSRQAPCPVAAGGEGVLGPSAVDRVAGVLLPLAQRLPAGSCSTRTHRRPTRATGWRPGRLRVPVWPRGLRWTMPTPSCPGTNGEWA